ncbi:MAG: hypothetical protein MSJ26_01285 [Oscillospiraceae bacterium]|nr:hypothetical protein [Oscillospiraceae bacterium]
MITKKVKLIALAAAAVITAGAVPQVSAAEYGWQESNGNKKYFMENDEYAKGIYVIDGVAYKFDGDGNYIGIYTGLCKKGQTMHFYDNGILYRDGWLKTGGQTYYFYPDGSAAVGITEIDGKTYYFTSTGALKKDKTSFTVNADKSSVVTGKRESICFTVSTDNIGSEAILGNIYELHRFKNGKWYKVKPDSSFSVPEIAYTLGKSSQYGSSTQSVALSFTPEDYKLGLESGLYRVKIPIYSDGRSITKYCEFNVIEGVEVTAPQNEYYLADTSEISLTVKVNKPSEIYRSESVMLYYKNEPSGQWEKVSPKDKSNTLSSYQAAAGSTVTAKLDLSRYSVSSLKTGKYRAVVGEGLSCDFKLIAPYECSAVQFETKSPRLKQITITVINDTDRTVQLKNYGDLYRLSGNKWKKLELKKGKKLDTELTVPAMTKWDKSFYLSDYYNLSDLKKGRYSIQLKDADGFVKYAYFDLK